MLQPSGGGEGGGGAGGGEGGGGEGGGEGGGKGGGGGREGEYRIGTGALIDAAELCSNPVSCTDEPPLRLVAACHRRPSQLH